MKVCNDVKEWLAKIVEAYHAELQKEPNVQKGLCTIAEFHGLHHNKLACAINSKRSIDEANAAKQKLTVAKKQKAQRLCDRERRKIDWTKLELEWKAIKEMHT
jgi:antitoxin component HigA of HigAB toxin-antitoxin module